MATTDGDARASQPEAGEPEQATVPLDSPEQAVEQWLRTFDTGLADAYCRMLELARGPLTPIDGRLAAHLGRDIVAGLIHKWENESGHRNFSEEFKNTIKKIKEAQPELACSNAPEDVESDGVWLDRPATECFNKLLQLHCEAEHAQSVVQRAAQRLLGDLDIHDNETIADLHNKLKAVRASFAQQAHLGSRPNDSELRWEIPRLVLQLTKVLHPMIVRRQPVLNETCKRAAFANSTPHTDPTEEEVEWIQDHVLAPDIRARFFAGLDNPRWLAQLRDNGVFTGPRGAAADYLIRMIGHDPEAVARIFVAWEKPNYLVIHQMAESVLHLPAEWAECVAKHLRGIMTDEEPPLPTTVHYFPMWAIMEGVGTLANSGKDDAALALLGTVTQYQPDSQDVRIEPFRWELVANLFEQYVTPRLAARCPNKVMGYLRDRLRDESVIPRRRADEGDPRKDLDPWLSAAVAGDVTANPIASILRCVRSAAQAIQRDNAMTVEELYVFWSKKQDTASRRSACWLVALAESPSGDLVARALDERLHDRREGDPNEYALLLQRHWHTLGDQQQDSWRERVRQGPTRPGPDAEAAQQDPSYRQAWIERILGYVPSPS